jgi:hypothetical protein
MVLIIRNLERDITQAIASRLAISEQLSDSSLTLITLSARKLATQLNAQFEREKKVAKNAVPVKADHQENLQKGETC